MLTLKKGLKTKGLLTSQVTKHLFSSLDEKTDLLMFEN